MQIKGGHIALPKGPGLGVIPNETKFDALVASF
jgi:L-alanine-DL-glutamate epimerase-like enolase superfamily enzyme